MDISLEVLFFQRLAAQGLYIVSFEILLEVKASFYFVVLSQRLKNFLLNLRNIEDGFSADCCIFPALCGYV